MNAIGTNSLWKTKTTGDVNPSTEEVRRQEEKRFPRRQGKEKGWGADAGLEEEEKKGEETDKWGAVREENKEEKKLKWNLKRR